MQIVHWGRARQFYREHTAAEQPLKRWRTAVQKASWNNFPEVRSTFNSADWVDGKIMFDIGGNNYRVVAVAEFKMGKLYIRQVLTHEEYDKGKWKE